ncbi:hypothetical protein BH09BAC1_BH09BAC1_25930 [soil metagenome]
MVEIDDELQEPEGTKSGYTKTVEWIKGIDIMAIFSLDNMLKNSAYLAFLFFLLILYIGNTHEMENTTRHIDAVKKEMKEYRWRYMSAKADLMFNCKMTEVARSVQPLGLKTLEAPPQKITIAKGEY